MTMRKCVFCGHIFDSDKIEHWRGATNTQDMVFCPHCHHPITAKGKNNDR